MAFKNAVVLTGGIATGKSTVANIFKGYGFEIIDADKIAHEMLDVHHQEIAELFGLEYVKEGKVIRKKLGALIFSDKKEKARLEALLHPLIFEEIEKESRELDKKEAPYLVDIPLFFETNRYPIKKSIVVYIPQKMQLERLMKRDNITKEEAQRRIDAQMNIEEKKHRATYLIENKRDLEALKRVCDRVKVKIEEDFKGK
jgi:dephospho-CoA kinase